MITGNSVIGLKKRDEEGGKESLRAKDGE